MANQQYIVINLNPVVQVTTPSPANCNPFPYLAKQVNAGLFNSIQFTFISGLSPYQSSYHTLHQKTVHYNYYRDYPETRSFHSIKM